MLKRWPPPLAFRTLSVPATLVQYHLITGMRALFNGQANRWTDYIFYLSYCEIAAHTFHSLYRSNAPPPPPDVRQCGAQTLVEEFNPSAHMKLFYKI